MSSTATRSAEHNRWFGRPSEESRPTLPQCTHSSKHCRIRGQDRHRQRSRVSCRTGEARSNGLRSHLPESTKRCLLLANSTQTSSPRTHGCSWRSRTARQRNETKRNGPRVCSRGPFRCTSRLRSPFRQSGRRGLPAPSQACQQQPPRWSGTVRQSTKRSRVPSGSPSPGRRCRQPACRRNRR